MKHDVLMGDNYDFCLAKLSIIKSENYWQKLDNIDSQRSIIFQWDCHNSLFGNDHILLHVLKSKFVNDYNVEMTHFHEQYGSAKVDYKIYRPNLLRTDEYIVYYQKNHRDFTVELPNNMLKKKS